MQRFFVKKESISAKQVIIADSRVHQIRDVLRMKIGDEIIVLNNTGMEYHVRLTDISQKAVAGEIIGRKKCEAEPRTSITLYQSMLARDKFEVVLQKCTEAGVSCFVPVITERSIVRKPEKITKEKLSRFESIIAEAAEQSGRGIIPYLQNPVVMNRALAELDGYDICLVGSTLDCVSLKEILHGRNVPAANRGGSTYGVPSGDAHDTRIALFIGPEGGFSDGELEVLNSRGVKPFSLGKRILRTETAGVVASAVILYELE